MWKTLISISVKNDKLQTAVVNQYYKKISKSFSFSKVNPNQQ